MAQKKCILWYGKNCVVSLNKTSKSKHGFPTWATHKQPNFSLLMRKLIIARNLVARISLMENVQTKCCPKVVTSILARLGTDFLLYTWDVLKIICVWLNLLCQTFDDAAQWFLQVSHQSLSLKCLIITYVRTHCMIGLIAFRGVHI